MQKCFVSIISRRNSSIVCKEREENCIFIQFLYFSRTRHMSRMQHTRQNAIFVLKNVLHLYLCIYRTFRIYVHHTDVLSDQFQVSLESSKNVMKLPQGIFLLYHTIFFPFFHTSTVSASAPRHDTRAKVLFWYLCAPFIFFCCSFGTCKCNAKIKFPLKSE